MDIRIENDAISHTKFITIGCQNSHQLAWRWDKQNEWKIGNTVAICHSRIIRDRLYLDVSIIKQGRTLHCNNEMNLYLTNFAIIYFIYIPLTLEV